MTAEFYAFLLLVGLTVIVLLVVEAERCGCYEPKRKLPRMQTVRGVLRGRRR